MKKFLLILIATIGICSYLSAQSAGDYRSVGSGNWNDPTKWEIYNGTNWVIATSYPGQSTGTGAVTIKVFDEIKLTATVPYSISSLLIDQLYEHPDEGVTVTQNSILVFSSENPVSLTVSGDVVIHGELRIDNQNGTKTHTLFVGGNFEVNTVIDDGCSYIIETIPATFQTINQDDKLGVVFTGSSLINNGPIIITFQDVTFNGTGFSVAYGICIKGVATFINGIVRTLSGYDVYYPCSIASNFNGSIAFLDGATVSGASNASFVDGVVGKLGDDPFTFPIGDENIYAPLTISAPVSQSAEVGVIYQRTNNLSSEPISDPGLFNISNCEFWRLGLLNLGLNNSVDVTVGWGAASGCGSSPYVTNVSDVTLAYYSGFGGWGWSNHGGSGIGTTTNGSVTWNGVTQSGEFTLGNIGACNPPPGSSVTNISWNSATLNWTAANGAVSYDVDYKLHFYGEWINAATATTSTSVNISGLNASTMYNWRVRTNCGTSSSPYRGGVFTTTECGAPSGLSTTNITTSSATLGWVAPAPNVSYRVEYKQTTSAMWITAATGITSLSYTLNGLSATTTYDWRVFSICNGGQSYYTQASFTTGSLPVVCTDVYEPNNTSSQAKAIGLGTTVPAMISSIADIDWFKITAPNNPNYTLRVTLANLPADFDLYVYDKNLTLVGASTNNGILSEVVIYNSNARKATYYMKVIGKNGAFNTSQCYSLLAQVSNAPNSASSKSYPGNEVTDISEKELLYPNPASEFVYLNFNSVTEGPVNIQIVNSIGQLVKQHPVNTIKGHNQFKIHVNDIRPGMYILRINKGELNMTRKFVIAR